MANVWNGLQSSIQFVKESSYGTDPTSGYVSPGKILSFNYNFSNAIQKYYGCGNAGGNNGLDVQDIIVGGVVVNARLSVILQQGHLLEGILGDSTNASGTHTFAGTTCSLPSFTGKFSANGTADDLVTFVGMLVTRVNLELSKNNALIASFDLIGKNHTGGTTAESYTKLADAPLPWSDSSFTWNSNAITTGMIQRMGFSAAVNYNPENLIGCGSRLIASQPPPGKRLYGWSVNATAYSDDLTKLEQDAMTMGMTAKTRANGLFDDDQDDMALRTLVYAITTSASRSIAITGSNSWIDSFDKGFANEEGLVMYNAVGGCKTAAVVLKDLQTSDYWA